MFSLFIFNQTLPFSSDNDFSLWQKMTKDIIGKLAVITLSFHPIMYNNIIACRTSVKCNLVRNTAFKSTRLNNLTPKSWGIDTRKRSAICMDIYNLGFFIQKNVWKGLFVFGLIQPFTPSLNDKSWLKTRVCFISTITRWYGLFSSSVFLLRNGVNTYCCL